MLVQAKYIGTGFTCLGLVGAEPYIDSFLLILNILGFTIILITLGTIVFKGGKGFIEGLKAVGTVASIIAAGAGSAAAGNSRDDREDRKKEAEEAEERKKAEEAEELKKLAEAEEAEKAKKEENAKKVDSFKNNIKSSSIILGWILSNVNV